MLYQGVEQIFPAFEIHPDDQKIQPDDQKIQPDDQKVVFFEKKSIRTTVLFNPDDRIGRPDGFRRPDGLFGRPVGFKSIRTTK